MITRLYTGQGAKHGNADGLSRREDPKENWKEGELEALLGHCPEPTTYEEALEDFRDFLKVVKELQDARSLDSPHEPPEEPDSGACRTIQASSFKVDAVMELDDWFYDSGRSMVQCVTADFRLITVHPSDPVHDPFLETLIQGLKRQPMPGDTLAVRDMESPRWRFYMITKKFAWEKTSYRTLRECLSQLQRSMEENHVYEVSMQRIGSQPPDFLNWWQTRGLISEVFTGSPMLVWVHYGGPEGNDTTELCSASQEVPTPTMTGNSTIGTESHEQAPPTADTISWVRVPCDVRSAQRDDPHIGIIFKMITLEHDDADLVDLGEVPFTKAEAIGYGDEVVTLWGQWPQLTIRKGILYRYWQESSDAEKVFQLVLPLVHQKDVLDQLHDSPVSGGHFAVEKTLNRIRQRFWWPQMRQHVEKKVELCIPCAARRTAGKRRTAELQPMQVGTRFNTVAADILGPVTKGGKTKCKYVLAMTDLFTKYVKTVPLKDLDAKEVANSLVENWVLRFGVPDVLHTDQGTNFNSDLMKEVCSLLQIDKSRTTAYHPEGNGQVERFNRVIADTISKYCAENPRTWDEFLPYVTFVYNTTVHKTTRATPFSLVYGQECQYPIDLFYPKPIDYEYKEGADFAAQLHETFREVQANARQVLGSTQRRRKDLYHKKVYGEPYKEGDKVWLFSPHKAKLRTFFLPWEGPYVVGERLNEVIYKVWKESKPLKWFTVHFNRLKPYKCAQPELRQFSRPRPHAEEVAFDYGLWGDSLLELDTPSPPPPTRKTNAAPPVPKEGQPTEPEGLELTISVPAIDNEQPPPIFTPSTPVPGSALPPYTFIDDPSPPLHAIVADSHQADENPGEHGSATPLVLEQTKPQHQAEQSRCSLHESPPQTQGSEERDDERHGNAPSQGTQASDRELGENGAGEEESQRVDPVMSRPKRMRFRPARYGIDD